MGSTCTAAVSSWFRGTGATRAPRRRAAGWTCGRSSSACGSSGRRRWWRRASGARPAPSPAAGATGRRSAPTTRSSRLASPPGCSATRTGGSGSSAKPMAIDTAGLDKALGAIGTPFRLTRLYPATHPAVQEGLRQIAAGLPGLAALGTVEWKIGATGLHWHGQHLLARNTQVAELAGLLYARGVRAIQVNPGVTPEQCLALFGVAIGTIATDDAALGRITLLLGRRASQRIATERASEPVPAPAPPPPPPPPPAPPPPAPETGAPRVSSPVFRPDALPPDLEAKRAVAGLLAAHTVEEQRSRVEQLRQITDALLALRNIGAIAEIIAGLDRALIEVQDPVAQEGIGDIAAALTDDTIVERMVARLGEVRVPPVERAHLVDAVGALAAVAAGPVVDAYLHAPAELREAYRATMRAAGERALETLQDRLASKVPEVAA